MFDPVDSRLPLKAWRWHSLVGPSAAALLALALIPYGVQIFNVVRQWLAQAPLQHLLAVGLQFANPVMPVLVVWIIWQLDSSRRHLVGYLLVGVLLAGGVNGIVKEISGRRRPEWSIDMDAGRERTMLERAARYPNHYIPVERRDIWLGLSPNRLHFAGWDASFPSGHACAAFALAAYLCTMYPRASWIWLFIAALSALARVKSGHHYLEDTLMGGAVAWAVSQWVYSWVWPGRVGLRLVRKLAGRRTVFDAGHNERASA